MSFREKRLLLLVIAAALAINVYALFMIKKWRLNEQENETLLVGEDIVSRIQREFNDCASTTELLADLYEVYGDTFLQDFDAICDELHKDNVVIGSLYFAPEGVIQYAYPKDVDRSTIGFAMLEDPIQGPKAQLAQRTKKTTVAGPHNLIEGKKGFIIRNPLFDKDNHFVGFTILIVHDDDFLRRIKTNIGNNALYYNFAVGKETDDPTAVYDKYGYILATGRKYIEPRSKISFKVPNDTWYLSIEPKGGWYNWSDMKWQILVSALIELLYAFFAYYILYEYRRKLSMEEMLVNSLEIDKLTGRYSKPAFIRYAQEFVNKNPDEQFDIALFDIKNFDMVNRAYGEETGDQVLIQLGAFLADHFPDGICARYETGRFAVICKALPSDKKQILLDLMKQFTEQSPVKNLVVKMGVYDGVDKNLTISRMCDRAAVALKSVKQNYDENIAFFQGQTSQKELHRKLYEIGFDDAIKNEEFVIWLQPQYDIRTNQIVGAEALVRWIRDGKMIPPGEFIEVFENDGSIGILDAYVFEHVCRYQAACMKAGKNMFPIAVNISRVSMHRPSVFELYKGIAKQYGVPLRYLPIEITESTAVSSAVIKNIAEQFHEAGFRLHLDDFGTGNSSLSTFNIVPFDVVKLDKSLSDYIGDAQGDILLAYTIALGKELGKTILAEGVETEEQLNFLREKGCEMVQGYYYSRPLPISEYEKKINQDHNVNEVSPT